jgi:hypothetical protein
MQAKETKFQDAETARKTLEEKLQSKVVVFTSASS